MIITRFNTINYKVNCDSCGVELIRSEKKMANNKNHYCSRECRTEHGTFLVDCGYCGEEVRKYRYELGRSENYFCNMKCKGKWSSDNLTGENGYNWRGGTWNNRVQYLAHTSYRTWRKKLLVDAVCIFCGTDEKLELHHIESKVLNPDRIKDESNVVPMCAPEHDTLHSNSSKGDELRGTLSDILSYGNPQPSRSNALIFVGRKVQRLMGEDMQADKPDTSVAPERDDIVRAY